MAPGYCLIAGDALAVLGHSKFCLGLILLRWNAVEKVFTISYAEYNPIRTIISVTSNRFSRPDFLEAIWISAWRHLAREAGLFWGGRILSIFFTKTILDYEKDGIRETKGVRVGQKDEGLGEGCPPSWFVPTLHVRKKQKARDTSTPVPQYS